MTAQPMTSAPVAPSREAFVHEVQLSTPPAPGAHMRQAVPGDIPAILRARRLTEQSLEDRGIKQWPVGDLTDDALRAQIDEGLWYVMVREADGTAPTPDTAEPAPDAPAPAPEPAPAPAPAPAPDGTAPLPSEAATPADGTAPPAVEPERTVRGQVTGRTADLPPAQPLAFGEQLLATVSWHEFDAVTWPDAAPGEARYLHGFMTNPESGVRGAGAQVLRWAEERTRREGVGLLRLDCLATNTSLVERYLRQGFTRVGTWEDPDHWYVGALFEKAV